MENTLSIKVRIGKSHVEIRRVTIATPKTFAEFQASLSDALELAKRFPGELRMRYEDEEGDEVTILTDADLREALRHVGQSQDKLMRLSVVALKEQQSKKATPAAAPSPARGCCPAMAGGHPLAAMLDQFRCTIPELLKNPGLRSMAEGLIGSNLVRVDTGRVCDSCNVAILGDRFASSTQQDFDLCSSCMLGPNGAALEAQHKFKKVTAFEALLQCLANGGGVDAFFAGGEAEAKAEPWARHAAQCDVCSGPIVGTRYKSFTQADYDECENCRASSKLPASDFFAISDPSIRSIPAEAIAEFKARKEQELAEAKAKEAEAKAKEAEQLALKAREEASRLIKPTAPVAVKQPEVVKAPEPCKPAVVEREPSAFEQNLQTLESMGFTDRKKSIAALVRNRNSLFATIQELLGGN